MKYVCKKDCYVRNPQGKLQHFKAGMCVDYASGTEVAEHFEAVEKKPVRGRKKEADVK